MLHGLTVVGLGLGLDVTAFFLYLSEGKIVRITLLRNFKSLFSHLKSTEKIRNIDLLSTVTETFNLVRRKAFRCSYCPLKVSLSMWWIVSIS